MAKLKRGRRNQRARHNPLGKGKKSSTSDDKQLEKDEASTKKSKILPLIEKLQSSSPNEASMALGAITVLTEDEKMRKLLLKEKLVQTVMEKYLNNNNDELVVEAFGLLRNLGIDEGYDILKYYWRSNVWVAIESSLSKVQQSFSYLQQNKDFTLTRNENVIDLSNNNAGANSKKKEDDRSKQQLLYDFTEHILSLIVLLGNASEDLYQEVFNKIDPVLTFVIDLINFNISQQKLTNKLFNCLLEFIYEFSNESDEFIKKLQQTELSLPALETFVESKFQESNKLGKTYFQGIKFHVNEVVNQSADKNIVGHSILSHLFNDVTTIDLKELHKNLTPNDNANEPIKNSGLNVEYNKSQSCRNDLTSIEVAIDLTTNIFEYLAINEDFQQLATLTPDLTELIFKILLPAIVELIQFELENDGIMLLIDKLTVCLNNLCWLLISVDNTPVQWYEASSKVWDLILNVSHLKDEQVQANCLNILWAITKALGPEIRTKVNADMVNQLINKAESFTQKLSQSSCSDNSNEEQISFEQLECYLSIIGFVGNLAIIIENVDITFQISEFLLRTMKLFIQPLVHQSNPKSIELVVESINLVFDIFADKNYSYDYEIFVQQGYLQQLKELIPQTKEMYKKIDKNKYGDLKLKGEETWNNLERFVKYKQSERK